MENIESNEQIKKRVFKLTQQDKQTLYFILGMSLAAIVYCITFSAFFIYIHNTI